MSNLISKIPQTNHARIVIVGGGFAELKLAMKRAKSDFQIIFLDKNNYHQFQPLFYQEDTAGLEPSSISFPLRKIFQKEVSLKDGTVFKTRTLLWAAGIKANEIEGFSPDLYGPERRLVVNEYLQIEKYPDIFVMGDMAFLKTDDYPVGHPQVAQAAIQQAKLIAKNLVKNRNGQKMLGFKYKDKGSLATIGRNMGVADLPGISLYGFAAWFVWIFVHLMAILGQKNKIFIFINGLWNYFIYDQSLRLILKQVPTNQIDDND